MPEAGLVAVLVDPDTGFAIWAGITTAEYKNLDSETAKKRLDYVVSTMFDDLPQ